MQGFERATGRGTVHSHNNVFTLTVGLQHNPGYGSAGEQRPAEEGHSATSYGLRLRGKVNPNVEKKRPARDAWGSGQAPAETKAKSGQT